MLFPIIKVRDSQDGRLEHIVGTNSHDTLFIDKESGGIHYMSLQNEESTEKVLNGEKYEMYAYEFVGEENKYSPYMKIEFVPFEKLFEIVMNEMEQSTEKEIKLNEMMRAYLDKRDSVNKKIEESRRKTGITRIS